MTSVREKLAALRARRAAQKNATFPSIKPALSAIAKAAGEPQVSWDADYKDRIRATTRPKATLVADADGPQASHTEDGAGDNDEGNIKLSSSPHLSEEEDEDDDELVVLPPPTPKLGAVAQRRLWRMREVGRAREKAAQSLLDSRPLSYEAEEVQPEPKLTSDGKEDYAGELDGGDESKDLGSQVDPDQDEEEVALQHAEDEDGSVDEEEREHERWKKGQEADAEADVSSDDESQPLREQDPTFTTPDQSGVLEKGAEAGIAYRSSPVHDTSRPCKDQSSPSNTGAGDSIEEDPKASRLAAADNDSEYARHSHDTQIPPRRDERLSRDGAGAALIADEADDDEEEERCDHALNDAEEDLDENSEVNDNELTTTQATGSVNEMVTQSDRKKMAFFHRKWVMDKEKVDVAVIKAGPRRYFADPSLEDAVDLTDFSPITKPSDGGGDAMEVPDNPNEDVGSQNGEASLNADFDCGGRVQSSAYVNAMFLRDDSRSKLVEHEEQEQEEKLGTEADAGRREQARALWKARQKMKSSFVAEDENSLSRFDLFGDADRSRSALLRVKLEKSCRPVEKETFTAQLRANIDRESKTNKRHASWSKDDGIPEWEKRKVCIQQKELKRRQAVSVGKWSYTSHGQNATRKVSKRVSSVGSASTTATYVARKIRSHNELPRAPNRGTPSDARRPKKAAKGTRSAIRLLGILGKRAETDL